MFEQEMLDKVEALLLGKVVKDAQSYQVAGRSITHFTIKELMELRDKLKSDIEKILLQKSLKKKGIKRIKAVRYV